ncbi:MAG TPA: hypothetical protein VK928_12235 [Longimicrobiales bacterium]|nr:hypothetical protein [Longimicrobiales bacterium]
MSTHDEDNHELRGLLRDSAQPPPFDDVDWRALRAGIQLRAQPLLRRPRTATWWQAVAGWARPGIPLTAAAAAALMLALGTDTIERRADIAPAEVTADDVAFRTLEEEFADVAPLLLAEAGSDQLIEAMLLYDGGDW